MGQNILVVVDCNLRLNGGGDIGVSWSSVRLGSLEPDILTRWKREATIDESVVSMEPELIKASEQVRTGRNRELSGILSLLDVAWKSRVTTGNTKGNGLSHDI